MRPTSFRGVVFGMVSLRGTTPRRDSRRSRSAAATVRASATDRSGESARTVAENQPGTAERRLVVKHVNASAPTTVAAGRSPSSPQSSTDLPRP